MIRLARLHHPVTTLGPGRRIGLWVQGCRLGCHGCMSRDTWDPEAGTVLPVEEVRRKLDDAFAADVSLTGLTVSGGEPLEQQDAVHAILSWLRADRPEVDSLLYTGWSRGRVRREAPSVRDAVDALIPEPFVEDRAPGGRWRGSANQPVLLFTELARRRHAGTEDDQSRSLQVKVEDGRLSVIGIPRPGDLDRMLQLAQARGLNVKDVSWSD